MTTKAILQVEDNPDDVFLLRTAFNRAGITSPLHIVTDGEMAIDYLSGKGHFADREEHPLPCIVLTDLKLPKKSGFEVLQWIRHQPGLKKLVVVVFSSSALLEDVEKAYELGTNAYIQKPAGTEHLRQIAHLLKAWLDCNQFASIIDPRGGNP